MELNYLTIQEALVGLKKKSFSAVELTHACFKQIKRLDKKISAFLTLHEDSAIQSAKKADELIHSSNDIFEAKPLLGIPMGIKDLYTTKDLRTTAGSKIIENYIPPFSATVVQKYQDAGAIFLGKTNEDAWGHGSSGENSDYGPTRNPYNLDYVPGGSSSGSGAAVASGECLLSTGTDTGSSVRLPAAYCNLVGLKPTYGRVSRYGVIAMASSFDTIGHMTHTVYDNAKVLETTAGHDPLDATSSPLKVPKYTSYLGQDIKGLKIGIPKEYFVDGMDDRVKDLTLQAIEKFKSLGAIIKQVSLPHTDVAMACYYILVPSEVSSNLARYDGIRYGNGRSHFGAEAKRRIMIGTYSLSSGYYDAYYKAAQKVRTLIIKDFTSAFEHVDVIFAPVAPVLPYKIGEKVNDPLTLYLMDIYTSPVNLSGLPSLALPAGFVDDLPVGIQIIGPPLSESRLFSIGNAYEKQ